MPKPTIQIDSGDAANQENRVQCGHADRGSSMRSDTLAQLFASLGVTRSFSRPRVSNDNPYSEALFKTAKYQPDYPVRFQSFLECRGWFQEFFGWYNDVHHHSGLALFTPSDVYHDRVDVVLATHQAALDAAFSANPARFSRGRPVAKRPADRVEINPVTAELPKQFDDGQPRRTHHPSEPANL